MFHLVVGHPLLPTTLLISIHMNHIHIALTLIIVLVIVHPMDNSIIFHMSKWTQIFQLGVRFKFQFLQLELEQPFWFLVASSSHVKLSNFRNCIILNIRSSMINLPILHPIIIQLHLHSPRWRILSRPLCCLQAKPLMKWRMPHSKTLRLLVTWRMLPWKTLGNCQDRRTVRISGCWSHHNRGRRVSKSVDGYMALHDWWGWF